MSGFVNQIAYNNYSQSGNYSFVKIDVLGRIRIPNFKKINEESNESNVVFTNVELIEDEISKFYSLSKSYN